MEEDKRAQSGRKKSSRVCPEMPREEAAKRGSGRVDVPVIFHQRVTDQAEDPIEGTDDLHSRLVFDGDEKPARWPNEREEQVY